MWACPFSSTRVLVPPLWPWITNSPSLLKSSSFIWLSMQDNATSDGALLKSKVSSLFSSHDRIRSDLQPFTDTSWFLLQYSSSSFLQLLTSNDVSLFSLQYSSSSFLQLLISMDVIWLLLQCSSSKAGLSNTNTVSWLLLQSIACNFLHLLTSSFFNWFFPHNNICNAVLPWISL